MKPTCSFYRRLPVIAGVLAGLGVGGWNLGQVMIVPLVLRTVVASLGVGGTVWAIHRSADWVVSWSPNPGVAPERSQDPPPGGSGTGAEFSEGSESGLEGTAESYGDPSEEPFLEGEPPASADEADPTGAAG